MNPSPGPLILVAASALDDAEQASSCLGSAGYPVIELDATGLVASPSTPLIVVLATEVLTDGQRRERLQQVCRRHREEAIRVIALAGRQADTGVRHAVATCLGLGRDPLLLSRPVERRDLVTAVREAASSMRETADRHLRRAAEAILAERLRIGIVRIDAGFGHALADPLARELLGCPEHLGRPALISGPFAGLMPVAQEVQQCSRPRSCRLAGAAGQDLQAFVEPDGQAVRLVILDPVQANRQLQQLQTAPVLEQQMAMLRHDLGAPLRQIHLWLELMQGEWEDWLADADDELLAHCRRAARRMHELVESATQITGADDEDLHCDPQVVLEHVLLELDDDLQHQKAHVEARDLPASWPMPAQDLHRILQNLIGNALRYRSSAAPQIHITGNADEDHQTLAVSDNGIGIAPELLPEIFTAWRTGPAANERGGTGLGLAICRQLAEAAGGELTVDSTEGVGSTFTLALPRPALAGSGDQPAAPA